MTTHIGILLFNQVEVLDFAGPFEVFTTASRMHARRHSGQEPLFSVFTVAGPSTPIRARGGLEVIAEYDLTTHPAIDLLLIPGGIVDDELERASTIEWIRDRAAGARITASVCTGAFLLAEAGLLVGRRATTHWEDAEAFARRYPEVQVEPAARWVDEGSVVTAAGISAGIDLSLHLVERLSGIDLARLTSRQMDYAWNERGAGQS
jgi:transcriptional regulator GlxA family with amidase domain